MTAGHNIQIKLQKSELEVCFVIVMKTIEWEMCLWQQQEQKYMIKEFRHVDLQTYTNMGFIKETSQRTETFIFIHLSEI